MNSLTFISYATAALCFGMSLWILLFQRERILHRLIFLSLLASAIAMVLLPTAMREHYIEVSDRLYLSVCCFALSLKYLLLTSVAQRDNHIPNALRRPETVAISGLLAVFAVFLQESSNLVEAALGYQLAILIAVLLLLASLWDCFRQLRVLTGLARTEFLYVALSYVLQALLFLVVLLSLDLSALPQRSLGIIVGGIFAESVVFYLFIKRRPPRFASAVIWVSLSATTVVALIVVYGFVVKINQLLFDGFPNLGPWITHLIAALVTSALLYPIRKNVVWLYRRIFPGELSLQDQTIVAKAIQILQSISTLPEASKRFAELLKLLLGITSFEVLAVDGVALRGKDAEALLDEDTQRVVCKAVKKATQPLVTYDATRYHLASDHLMALQSIEANGFEVAIALPQRSDNCGCVLLGRDVSSRYFSQNELEILEPLVEAFSTAIENAELYTRLRDARVYNSMLLESLDSGVIATDVQGKITLCNKEALRILSVAKSEVVNQPVNVLPAVIATATKLVLESKTSFLHQEDSIAIESSGVVPLRYSIAPFDNYIGESLGVIIVLNDLSHLKMLQRRAQRSDRLASLGTLAAGMAHEIKNPLVSVKTFTELLPMRHEDSDFRDQFSTLVMRELERIEEIVDRLLDFAQPSKVKLERISLRKVLADSILLVAPQCEKHSIALEQSLDCGECIISGDAKMLGQVFTNLLLNAIDAIGSNGTLTVSAERCRYDKIVGGVTQSVGGVVVKVRDTGCGIPQENLARIFDPFFTTKSSGTGLGLPITYGIVQEHGATIDAQSDGKTGTTFLVTFPAL